MSPPLGTVGNVWRTDSVVTVGGWGGGVTGIKWEETRDTGQHPTAQDGLEAGGRRPPPPPGKPIGDSFPVDRNSKMRITGQLNQEAGPCPDHVYLIPKSGELPGNTCREKLLEGQSGSDVKGCSTHRPLRWKPSWLRDACTHVGGF